MQEKTAEAATNARKEWTGPEMELLLREDLSAATLATMLGRSLYAVKHMRRKVREPRGEALAGVQNQAALREASRVAALVAKRSAVAQQADGAQSGHSGPSGERETRSDLRG